MRVEREAREKREALERQRQEAEERARRERKEDYDRKLAAVMNATNQTERVGRVIRRRIPPVYRIPQ